MNVPLCDMCSRKPAFYLAPSSGKRICPSCMEKMINKAIKASLRRASLRPKSVIGVVIPFGRVIEGAMLAHLVSKIEARFNTIVVVIYPRVCSNLCEVLYKLTIPQFTACVSYHVADVKKPQLTGDLISITLKETERLMQTFEPSPKITLLPYTLTDINETFLESLMAKPELMNTIKKIKILLYSHLISLPFNNFQRRDILAFAYKKNTLNIISGEQCSQHYNSELAELPLLVNELEYFHSELSYSSLKSLEKILDMNVK